MSVKIMCGACDRPASIHPVELVPNSFVIPCGRRPEDIGNASWRNEVSGLEFSDYRVEDGNILLPLDLSGPEAQSTKYPSSNEGFFRSYRHGVEQGAYGPQGYEDEQDYVSPAIDQAKVDRWKDSTYKVEYVRVPNLEDEDDTFLSLPSFKSWIVVEGDGEFRYETRYSYRWEKGELVTSKQFSKVPAQEEISYEERNAYVEGNEGFLSLKLLDEQLTRRYHAKLLNVFRDKQTGQVRIGSVRIEPNADGTLSAQCVQNACKAKMTTRVQVADLTRIDMEEFVWACIAHGNNHSAKWLKERPTYYALHRMGCPAHKDPRTNEFVCFRNEVCTYRPDSPHREALTDDEQFAFILDHNSKCRDSKCRCSEVLAELRPDLMAAEALASH